MNSAIREAENAIEAAKTRVFELFPDHTCTKAEWKAAIRQLEQAGKAKIQLEQEHIDELEQTYKAALKEFNKMQEELRGRPPKELKPYEEVVLTTYNAWLKAKGA